jgi:hypothetical protein
MDLGLYNKTGCYKGLQGTLMGNWSEERALQFATGEARYPVSI